MFEMKVCTDKNAVRLEITTTTRDPRDGRCWAWWFTKPVEDVTIADLVVQDIERRLCAHMQHIRCEAYNRGWKNAKAKKHGKQTYFSGEL